MGLFSIFGANRRADITDEVWAWVVREHPIFGGLSPGDLALLRDLSARFRAGKQFMPVRGAVLAEETAISVSAQACLPILHLGLSWYRDWSTLYLTPDEYEYEDSEVDVAGVVHETSDIVSGQVLEFGSVALSIRDVEASGWCEGYNVVIHEMAHVIDRQNGSIDGAPPLHREMEPAVWTTTFSAAYEDFQEYVASGEGSPRGSARGGRRVARMKGPSRIDPYAAEAPEEFFAVASEIFFEQPRVLRTEYPEVYAQLVLFYRQDPDARLSPARRSGRQR